MHAPARPSSPITAQRIALFLGFFTVLLAIGMTTAFSAWAVFGGEGNGLLWTLLLPSFLFAPALFLSWRRHTGEAEQALKLLYRIGAVSTGLLSYLFLAGALTWIFGGVAYLLGWYEAARACADLFFGLGVGATVFGLVNALFRLRVTRRDVYLPHLPVSWHGRTVALVTDLHLGNIYGPGFSRRVVERLRSLAPDLVLVGGDLFDGTEGDFEAALAPWKLLAPPFGVHYVTGNHEEHGESREGFLWQARRAGMRELNGKVELDGLQLLGLHDAEAGTPEIFEAFLGAAAIDRSRAALLLAHIPHQRNFPPAVAAGVSLYLSGHTHQGQVWPWNILANRMHGPFVYGLHPFGDGALQVCTSSGAGSWGPPMRVGTRSEVVLLRLLSV